MQKNVKRQIKHGGRRNVRIRRGIINNCRRKDRGVNRRMVCKQFATSEIQPMIHDSIKTDFQDRERSR